MSCRCIQILSVCKRDKNNQFNMQVSSNHRFFKLVDVLSSDARFSAFVNDVNMKI
eukprot:m.205859 g.205859  ORF g.205859 m.205859 type:complete len:55 (-) comp18885_c0_seq2:1439-1603(-)